MQNIRTAGLLALMLVFSFVAGTAFAQVEEVRLGVLDHDINLTGNGAGGKEGGVNIAVELVFASPNFLSWAWSPRPFIHGSLNTDGLTNFAGAGLSWQFDLTDRIFFESNSGLVIHDGITQLSDDPGDPERILLDATRVILGSRVLFRLALSLGVRVNDDWDASVVFEHLSHGQILASGRNEGLDNIGFRLSRKF